MLSGTEQQQEVPITSKDGSDNKPCLVFSKDRTGSRVRVCVCVHCVSHIVKSKDIRAASQ